MDTTWNLTPLGSGDDDPLFSKKREQAAQEYKKFAETWRDRTDYLEDPETLSIALKDFEALVSTGSPHMDESYYFHLRTSQDSTDPVLKAREDQIEEFSTKLANQIRFFELQLGYIPPEKQEDMLNHSSLSPYIHYLETVFAEAAHQLSEKEENILSLMAQPAYGSWVRMTASFLAKEEREVINDQGETSVENFSSITSLLSNPDQRTRDTAATAFNEILSTHIDVGESELNAILSTKKVNDELRHFSRPDAARHLSDDIDSSVVDALIEAVTGHYDIPQQYYLLKAKLMGKKKLAYHERNVEIGDTSKQYSYEEATSLVTKTFSQLDPNYVSILEQFQKRGQIDVYPAKGKHGGAYCAGNHSTLSPTYILLNHTNQLNDVLTFAHELGHGINNELAREKQSELNFGTPLSTAEVASTFMEDFVLDEILKEADDELRLSILIKKVNDDISTIFRQVALYQFEQELHDTFRTKGYLPSATIGEMFSKHMSAYMGEGVEQSPGSENWWLYWSHIRSYFYVYSYASGQLIAKALQAQVRENPTNIRKVNTFLSAGLSKSPKALFKDLGVNIDDPTFWDEGIDRIQELLDQAKQLAQSLGKLS